MSRVRDVRILGILAGLVPHVCSGSIQRLGPKPRKWHPTILSTLSPRSDSVVPLEVGRAGLGQGGGGAGSLPQLPSCPCLCLSERTS